MEDAIYLTQKVEKLLKNGEIKEALICLRQIKLLVEAEIIFNKTREDINE